MNTPAVSVIPSTTRVVSTPRSVTAPPGLPLTTSGIPARSTELAVSPSPTVTVVAVVSDTVPEITAGAVLNAVTDAARTLSWTPSPRTATVCPTATVPGAPSTVTAAVAMSTVRVPDPSPLSP